jgi:hypothetical protein
MESRKQCKKTSVLFQDTITTFASSDRSPKTISVGVSVIDVRLYDMNIKVFSD